MAEPTSQVRLRTRSAPIFRILDLVKEKYLFCPLTTTGLSCKESFYEVPKGSTLLYDENVFCVFKPIDGFKPPRWLGTLGILSVVGFFV